MPQEKSPNGLELDVVSLRNCLAPQLLELSSETITGSRLAPLIDACLRPANYRSYFPINESPRLRNFVEKYLGELVSPTDERSGVDPIYRIAHVAGTANTTLQPTGQLWRTFAALTPTQQLSYDRETAELGLVDPLAEETETVVFIPSVSFPEHRRICEDFYLLLVKRGQEVPLLQALLKEFEPNAYPVWLRTLRTSRPPLDKEWGHYRQEALLALFRTRLANLNVPMLRIGQLELQLARDHEHIIQKKVGKNVATKESSTAVEVALPAKDSKEKRTRELLHAAVDRLSLEQMQSLLVPFGVLVDVLHSQTTK